MKESPLFDNLAIVIHQIREKLKQACIREVADWTGLQITTLYNIRQGRNLTVRNLELLAVYFDNEQVLKDPDKARALLPAFPWPSLISIRSRSGEIRENNIKLTPPTPKPTRDPSLPVAPWEESQQ